MVKQTLDLRCSPHPLWRGGCSRFVAVQPADAQQRKSLRWTTSQVGSYGYTVAASMAKIVEQALGGEYTVTVQPYPSPTVAMKAVMNGDGEIAYTADIGMTEFHDARRRLQGLQAEQAGDRAHLVRLSDGIDDGDDGQECRQVSSAGRTSAASRCSSRRPAS